MGSLNNISSLRARLRFWLKIFAEKSRQEITLSSQCLCCHCFPKFCLPLLFLAGKVSTSMETILAQLVIGLGLCRSIKLRLNVVYLHSFFDFLSFVIAMLCRRCCFYCSVKYRVLHFPTFLLISIVCHIYQQTRNFIVTHPKAIL